MLRRVLLIAGALLLLLVGWLALTFSNTLPDRGAAVIDAPGLSAPVHVAFDDAGRPWIDASGYGDALFALGWVQARDRRWQMELFARAGSGRLAALLGASLFETDAAMIRAGVPELAEALERNAQPETLAFVDRFVAGVALADAEGAGSPEYLLLGVTPEPFSRKHVFAIGALMAFDSANNMTNELLRLALVEHLGADAALFLQGDRISADQPWVVDPGESAHGTSSMAAAGPDSDSRSANASSQMPRARALERLVQLDSALHHPMRPRLVTGSSAWAVASSRSETGHALLAFDSHDAWSMPSLMYEAHLFWRDETGAARQLRGWTVAGLPGVINGFTEGGGWGLTNIGDSQDLVIETLRETPTVEALGTDGWYPVRRGTRMVEVRGGVPREVEVLHTRHGPLVSTDPPLALMWSGHAHEGAGLEGLFALNRARSWEEASAAVDRLFAPSANLTWADRDGRVASRVHGRLPQRARGEGLLPLRTAEGAARWTGFVSMAALPRVVDPRRGHVAAANARTSPGVPLVSADNAPGYRARRLRTRLSGDAQVSVDPWSVDAFRRLQVDFHDHHAERLLPVLLAATREGDLPADVSNLLHAYAAQPLQNGDSAGAVLFAYWFQALLDVVFADRLGPELHTRLLRARYPTDHAMDRLLLDDEHAHWWRGDRDARIREALSRAWGRVVQEMGEDPNGWRWDAVHRVHFPHQLGEVHPLLDRLFSRGPWGWGGGNATLGRARYGYHQPFEARGGASMRMVVEMTHPPTAYVVTAGGQSGNVFDPHYDDQFEDFLAGRLTRLSPTWVTREQVIELVPVVD